MVLQPVYIGETDFYVGGVTDWIKEKKQQIEQGKDKIKHTKKALTSINQLWDIIYKVLQGAGFPEKILPFATSQALMESNFARSAVAQEDKNFSGIKFRGRPGTIPGRKSPEGDNYARYLKGMPGWAVDFKRVISQKNTVTRDSKGGPAAIDADSLRDYVHRLKVNGYFGASELSYYNLLKGIIDAHGNIPNIIQKGEEAIKIMDNAVDRVEHPFTSLLPKIPTWAKVGGAVVGGLIIIKLISK